MKLTLAFIPLVLGVSYTTAIPRPVQNSDLLPRAQIAHDCPSADLDTCCSCSDGMGYCTGGKCYCSAEITSDDWCQWDWLEVGS
ncbi:uncharacterized protein ASPGLDRAFT_35241 [Aspergillus glaucus CBS 516.65]|uniref:Uncharacterized protein n=1 Tax=Aspergillus glaucus CBS 516.65 TaxID=1160497 RepID=A0A1L9VLH6_ASPGL|nr:hypothetical protein ASPGLDRAFT_35241 [Aspergillus glaucus CBS 516.65]OJJ84777.1 hypothetical protein ASPGLDRAFT_35241 [Aspergillus glaucus CBS 516.65]